jgi:O-antigen/teichoic acid export membrane protein
MQAENPLQNAYRAGIRWSFAGSTGAAIFQFAQMVVFARLAGPEAAGDYALAATFISFLTPVAEAGLSQAIVQAARIQARQLATLAWVNCALGALIFFLLWHFGASFSVWFNSKDLPGLLLLMGASLLVTPFGAQYSGLITREMQFEKAAKIEIGAWLVSFTATTFLVFAGWGAWAMALGFLLRNIFATLGSIWVGRQIMPINLLKTNSLRDITPLLRFGAFELSSRWADFFSNYLDKIIIAKWLGTTALGYYTLAFTFLMLPTARIGNVVSRVAFPLFARIRHDKIQLQAFFERSAREIILLLYPIYLAMILFSSEILYIGFGEKWLPAAPLFVALGLAGLVRTLCAPFPQLVKGLGKPQYWLVWMLLFSSFLGGSLLLFLWMQPTAASAAWSRTAAKFSIEILLLWGLAKWCKLDFVPLLKFAGQTLLWLLPTVALTWLAGMISSDIWLSTALKSITFGLSLVLTYRFSPLRAIVQQLLQNFVKPANAA